MVIKFKAGYTYWWSVDAHIPMLTEKCATQWYLVIIMPWLGPIKALRRDLKLSLSGGRLIIRKRSYILRDPFSEITFGRAPYWQFCQICDVMRGECSLLDPVTLELPNRKMTSTCYATQTIFPRRHFRQTDEVVQVAIDKIDEHDLFDTVKLEFTMDFMSLNKPLDHDEFILEIICGVYRHHLQWLLSLYNNWLRKSISLHFTLSWKLSVAVYFHKEGRVTHLPSYFTAPNTREGIKQHMRNLPDELLKDQRCAACLIAGNMFFGVTIALPMHFTRWWIIYLNRRGWVITPFW